MARDSDLPDAIKRALLLIPRHPEVLRTLLRDDSEPGYLDVDVEFNVNLPSSWIAGGKSPNGIRSREQVRFHFPETYPLDPPVLSLRPDFDRSHPHIHPTLWDDRPMPCVSDLPLSALLHQQGLRGILNQTAVWLANAALNKLIDPKQGWEPARRDDLSHGITVSSDKLRQLVKKDAGHGFLPFEYFLLELERGGKGLRGAVDPTPTKINPSNLSDTFQVAESELFSRGRSLLLFVWPGKNKDGTSFICDKYRPDDVQIFRELLARATEYGVAAPLSEQLSWLRKCAGKKICPPNLYLGIILCVRRPIHLIGSESDLELIPYVAKLSDALASNWESKKVEAAAHSEQLSPRLCRTLSGTEEFLKSWTLIGAGSLGSKIAMHLTRQGMAPRYVIDNGQMRTHNAVRHALAPESMVMRSLFIGHKAPMLTKVIEEFGQRSDPIQQDAAKLLRTDEGRRKVIIKDTVALVNAAASIKVREALAARNFNELETPVIETSLFAEGSLGLVTIEGRERNPNTGDLITEFYRLAAESPKVANYIFAEDGQLGRVPIGDGCASATMVVSDAKISAHAAAMSQIVAKNLVEPTPLVEGRVFVGYQKEDSISLDWTKHDLLPVKLVSARNNRRWTIRTSPRVHASIAEEIGRWPNVETGGILIGRISEMSHTFYVVDTLPAPPDSERSAALFVLGKQGVKAAIKEYSDRHGWSLYCLGTWHSHLGASTPSVTDNQTAKAISIARVAPSLLLIKAPAEYSALVADAAEIIEVT